MVAAGGGTLMWGAWHYLASSCLSLLCGIAGSSCQGTAKPEDHSAILEATNREQLGAVAEAITTVGVNPGVVETLVAQQLPEVVPTPSRSPRHASRKRCYGTMHPGFVSMFAKYAACRYH